MLFRLYLSFVALKDLVLLLVRLVFILFGLVKPLLLIFVKKKKLFSFNIPDITLFFKDYIYSYFFIILTKNSRYFDLRRIAIFFKGYNLLN